MPIVLAKSIPIWFKKSLFTHEFHLPFMSRVFELLSNHVMLPKLWNIFCWKAQLRSRMWFFIKNQISFCITVELNQSYLFRLETTPEVDDDFKDHFEPLVKYPPRPPSNRSIHKKPSYEINNKINAELQYIELHGHGHSFLGINLSSDTAYISPHKNFILFLVNIPSRGRCEGLPNEPVGAVNIHTDGSIMEKRVRPRPRASPEFFLQTSQQVHRQ